MTDETFKQQQKNQEAWTQGSLGRPIIPDSIQEFYAHKNGLESKKRRDERSARSPANGYSALGILFTVIAGAVFVLKDVQSTNQHKASSRSKIALAEAPTHYINKSKADFFYATGPKQGKKAATQIVTPPAGKCFDLSKQNGSRTVTIHLEDYYGKVYKMQTSPSNFTRLPAGARCVNNRYKP